MASEPPGTDGQRLDAWLWCARLARNRAACTALVEAGGFRINRQPTDKAHARVRAGDVLTFPVGTGEHAGIRVWRVRALAGRRGSATDARRLYDDLTEPPG